MTKLRPSWSEACRRVAALCCGLFLAATLAAEELPAPAERGIVEGLASYYGGKFHGRSTASGERFDKTQFTAASNRFPIGTRVAVLRPLNGLCVIVRVNDRMHRRHRVRVIDISRGAADYLEMLRAGVVKVRVAVLRADWSQRGPRACADAFDQENCLDCRRPQESATVVGDPADVEYNPAGIVTLRSETGLSAQ